MEPLTIKITFLGAEACYRIRSDRFGVFEAALLHYTGSPQEAPPSFLLLIQSLGQWVGTVEMESLTQALGQAIEPQLKS